MKKRVSRELQELIKKKGNLCLSVIVPLHSNPATSCLLLRPPGKKYFLTIPDAVDDIIEMIIEKNVDIVFTYKGRLEQFEHIALINRY